MTKEQAIEHLKADIKYWENTSVSVDHLYMAIKALEQQPSEDCVSRENVLEALKNNRYSDAFCDEHGIERSINLNMSAIAICELPSVTPTQCIAAIRFSKEDLKEICNERIEIACEHSTCMNCKYNRPNSYARTMFSCERGNRFKLRDCENFYCADFEKRGNEE